jgi:hypothetical protein
MIKRASGVCAAIILSVCNPAFAQEDGTDEESVGEEGLPDEPGEEDASPAAASVANPPSSDTQTQSEPSSSKEGADGGRFRFGIAGGAGPMSGGGLSLTYYGMDLRFGAQLNDAIGIYAQPQLGYYKLNGADALFGSGGLIGASVLADYTLFDRLFLGAGVGYAILNNPSGMELHFRAGGYPMMGRSKEKVRRKAMMLGADLRMHFVEGVTFIAPTFNLGYEAF